MTAKRVFYVIYAKDPSKQKVLDAIRFLAEPGEKNRAHVTVRGPYQQRYKIEAANRVVSGTNIDVRGVDAFLNDRQSTVYFVLESPGIQKAWRKLSYSGFKPHLTIYDGKSRWFAERLRAVLDSINPQFSFRASTLQPLVSVKGQADLDLQSAYDPDLVRQITGEFIPGEHVADLPAHKRLQLIAALSSFLAKPDDATSQAHEKHGSATHLPGDYDEAT